MAEVNGHAIVEVVQVKELSPPPVGALMLCMICALEKPWGVFDSKTGASVCIECRDKARAGMEREPYVARRYLTS